MTVHRKSDPLVTKMIDLIGDWLNQRRELKELAQLEAGPGEMLPPQYRIDQIEGIEGCDDDISDAGVTVGTTGLTRKFDTHLPELYGEGGV